MYILKSLDFFFNPYRWHIFTIDLCLANSLLKMGVTMDFRENGNPQPHSKSEFFDKLLAVKGSIIE